MFRNILFTMSLSGSIIVVLYMLFYPLAQRYFPLVWRYRVLKVAIFFYLVPVAECKYGIFGVLQFLFPNLWNKIYRLSKFDATYSISTEGGFIRLSPNVYKMICSLVVCAIISGIIFSRILIQNQRIKKIYIAGTDKFTNKEIQDAFLEVQKELNIKRPIKFVYSEYCQSPVTCGVIFPVVWFPAFGKEKTNNRLFRYMIKHELLHIKRNDILVKYLGLLVMAVHWFNPFSYFLYHELSSIAEMYCDSGVLEGQEETCRKEYGELLLQAAVRKTSNTKRSFFIGMADKGHQRIMKRRIMEMKAERKNKNVFSIIIMIFICITGGVTAFAYEPPYKVGGSGSDNFTFEREFVEKNAESIPWDHYFIDSDGTVFRVVEQDHIEKGVCNHTYSTGTMRDHFRDNNGGCTIIEYEALRCSLCGYILKKEETNVITYKKCPH